MIRVFIDLEMNMVAQKNTELRALLPHEIIEIGAVKLNEKFQIIDRFCCYVKPRYNSAIHWSVAKLTGIKAETLKNADYLEQVLPRFVKWLGEETVLMYAWSDSDHAQIERECNYKQLWNQETRQAFSHWTDFQKVFTKSVGYRNAISLSKAIEYMGLAFDGTKHDALSDAENCARLMVLMQDEAEYCRRKASFPPEPVRKAVCTVAAEEKKEPENAKTAKSGKNKSRCLRHEANKPEGVSVSVRVTGKGEPQAKESAHRRRTRHHRRSDTGQKKPVVAGA